jgi:hypothetical protein
MTILVRRGVGGNTQAELIDGMSRATRRRAFILR